MSSNVDPEMLLAAVLMRHDLLVTLKPIPAARITEIVDDLSSL